MYPHTPRTRSRYERLAGRTEYGWVAAALSVPLVALVHPVAAAAVGVALLVGRLGRAPDGESPTGHGRARSPPSSRT